MKNTTIHTTDEGKKQRNGTGDVLAQAATTKYCRLGGFNNTKLFSIVLEAGTSKTKLMADSVLSEGSLPDLQMKLKIHDGRFSFSLLSGMGWRRGGRELWFLFLFLQGPFFPL